MRITIQQHISCPISTARYFSISQAMPPVTILFSIECSYNTDFNDMFGDATERVFTFYSWGMIEKWTVPKANLTTKLIYMRLSEENNYLLE